MKATVGFIWRTIKATVSFICGNRKGGWFVIVSGGRGDGRPEEFAPSLPVLPRHDGA